MTKNHPLKDILDRTDNLLQQGKHAEAIALLEDTRKTHPGEEPVLLRLAWACWDQGDKKRSIGYWEILLDRELQRPVFTGFAYDELVRIYKQEGHFARLVDVCEKAASVQPQDVGLLEELGKAHMLAGNHQKACEVFEKLVSLEEDHPAYHCLLGEALFAAERTRESEAAFMRAGALDPEASVRYTFKIADLFARGGHHAEAQRLLQGCIAADPAKPLYYCALGDVLIATGADNEALAAYETAAGLDHRSAGSFYNRMGNTFMKEKNYNRAAQAFQKAIECDPLPPYRRNLTAALSASGQSGLKSND